MKFQIGDKAIVGKSVDRPDFLKHVLQGGQEVEIAGPYTGWKGKEAYILKNEKGIILTEYLLAEELKPVKGGSLFDKYKKAGFDCLFFFDDGHGKGKWCCGFFCQGKESILNDGLICYLPLQGKSEKIRDKHLSKLLDTVEEAINDSYKNWRANKKS